MKTSNIANGIANALNLSPKSLEIIADYVDINNKIYHNFNVVLEVVKTMAKLDVTPNSNNDSSDNISVRGYNLSIPYESLPMITGHTFYLSLIKSIKQHFLIILNSQQLLNKANPYFLID